MRIVGRLDHDECAPWCNHEPEDHHPFCDDSFCPGRGGYGWGIEKSDLIGGDCFKLAQAAIGTLERAHTYLMTTYSVWYQPEVMQAIGLLAVANSNRKKVTKGDPK
jgi:hypothetical protein